MKEDHDPNDILKWQRGLPVIPKLPPDQPNPGMPNPPVAMCGECGLEIRQVMHYVCGNPRCPVFTRVTFGGGA